MSKVRAVTLNARDLLNESHLSIWRRFNEHEVAYIQFDDKKVKTSIRQVIVSRSAWLFHEIEPSLPLMSEMHQDDPYFTPASLSALLNRGYWQLFEHTTIIEGRPDPLRTESWRKDALIRINDFYNCLRINCAMHARGICANDYMDIIEHPPIAEIRNDLHTTPYITPMYYTKRIEEAKKILLNDPLLSKNPVAIACRCKTMKIDQVMQLTVSRGYGSDVDSRIFGDPIRPAFMDGFERYADSLMLSRDGAAAKYYQGPPTQQSEYLNRRMRLLAMVYRGIASQDCNSTDYIENIITDEQMLTSYLGKFYLDEETNQLKPIRAKDKHLIGKLLKLRMLESCKTPDRYKICWRCYGELADSIAQFANIGWTAAATLVELATQNILSKKHVVLSAILNVHSVLNEAARMFVHVSEDDVLEGNMYLIRQEDVDKYRYEMVLSKEESMYIADLEHVANINDVSLERTTKITVLLIRRISRTNPDDVTEHLARIGHSESNAFLSSEMLKYIIANGFTTDTVGNHTISLDEWDYTIPFVKFPPALINVPAWVSLLSRFITNKSKLTDGDDEDDEDELRSQMDDQKRVKKFLAHGTKSIDEAKDNISKYPTPMAGINAFMQIVLPQLKGFNIVHLEVLAFSMCIENSEENKDCQDLRPPLNRRGAKFMSFTHMMSHASVSRALAFEKQSASIYSVRTSLVRHRAAHPFDELVNGVDN